MEAYFCHMGGSRSKPESDSPLRSWRGTNPGDIPAVLWHSLGRHFKCSFNAWSKIVLAEKHFSEWSYLLPYGQSTCISDLQTVCSWKTPLKGAWPNTVRLWQYNTHLKAALWCIISLQVCCPRADSQSPFYQVISISTALCPHCPMRTSLCPRLSTDNQVKDPKSE